MQPRAFSAKKRLTRRSSSEWKVSAAMRPPIFVDAPASSGSASSSWVQLAVDRDPDRLERALGRVAAGEAGGRGDRGGDRVVELEGRRQLLAAAAADDLARDPVREALLAVLAQRARDPAAVPGVDDLERRELLARVHAHVERRVVGVGEPALAVVDLHRAHAQVHVDEVRARRPPRSAAARPVTKSARMKRVSHATSAASCGERGLGGRVAVDRDQRSGRAEALGDEPRVAGAAERAVDRRSGPACGSSASISSPARTGTCVWGMSRRMAKGLGEVRRSRREVGFVGLPGRAVPELEAVADAGDHDLAVDPRVLQELRRQHHAAGGIQLGLQGVPVEDAPQLAALLARAGCAPAPAPRPPSPYRSPRDRARCSSPSPSTGRRPC